VNVVFVERPQQKGWTIATTQDQSSRHPEKQPKPMVVNFIIWRMYVCESRQNNYSIRADNLSPKMGVINTLSS
jgi:hypothetical protein